MNIMINLMFAIMYVGALLLGVFSVVPFWVAGLALLVILVANIVYATPGSEERRSDTIETKERTQRKMDTIELKLDLIQEKLESLQRRLRQ